MKARSYALLGALALAVIVGGGVFLAERLMRPGARQAAAVVEQPPAEVPPRQEPAPQQAEPAQAQSQQAEPAQVQPQQAEPTQAEAPEKPQATPQGTEPRREETPPEEIPETAVANVPEKPAEPVAARKLEIALSSPKPQSMYGAAVSVTGRTSGTAAASLSWAVDGTDRAGETPIGADGRFAFSFSTIGLKGALTVTVRARDADGKTVTAGLALADRPSGPSLVVDSPADKAVYGDEVDVTGRVGDPKDPSGTPAEVKSLSWRVVGVADRAGEVSPRENGAFSFRVPTKGLTGTLVLELHAVDLNDRATTRVIKLTAAVAETAAEGAAEGPAIAISSPRDGGYYKDITVVEGRVGSASAAKRLKSFTYEVSGGQTLTGKVVATESGAFKVPLMLTAVSGDATIVFTAEDADGRQDRGVLTLRDGRLKPGITLSSPPAKEGSYGTLLRVAGRVSDPYAGTADMEGIESLTWLLSSVEYSRTTSPTRGTAALGQGGAFRFAIATKELTGAQNLTLTAAAVNGNKAEMTVRLSQADGDVSSFTALPADRSVMVSWDSLPFATRYDVYWAPGGASPGSGQVRRGVTSPVTLSGLENGTVYSLQVRVQFDDGESGESTVTRVIPLSPQTLAPVVKGDYMKIRLSWKGVTGAAGYDVWRSLTGSDVFTRIAEALSVTTYVDSAVEYGREYSYQISPAGILAPRSASGRGKSQAFPADKIARLGTLADKEARSITLSGGYAYIASGANGIRIVDISTPEKPVVSGRLATESAWDVAVRADYAYVADGESGLKVLDITAPNAPVLLGTRKTLDARAVVLHDSYAYVADGVNGLKVIDVSDVLTLNRVASLDTTNSVGLALAEGRLYVADGAGGLRILDLKKPAAPSILGSLPLADARDVAVEGRTVYVADGASGLRIVDVSDPAKPALLATFPMAMAASVSYNKGYAYVADGKTGITVIDLQNPSSPRLFMKHPAAGATCVRVADEKLYIADDVGLEVARIQIKGRSFQVASCETAGKAFAVTVAGDWAYVSGHALGIQVVNVAEPGSVGNASLVGSLSTRFATNIGILDSLAFVADGTGGMRVIDVSPAWAKPAAGPVEVGSYRPGGNVGNVAAVGTTAYIAAGEQGVHIVDTGTPSALKELGSVRTANAQDIVVRGTWAFVADGDAGLRVVDVSKPASPALLPAVVKVNAKCLARMGDLILVGGSTGVSVVDAALPASPRLVGRYENGRVEAMAVNGKYAYVAEGFKGLTVLDLSQPENPMVISTCTDIYAVGVAAKGYYALVTDSFGLRVIQILIPEWLLDKK